MPHRVEHDFLFLQTTFTYGTFPGGEFLRNTYINKAYTLQKLCKTRITLKAYVLYYFRMSVDVPGTFPG